MVCHHIDWDGLQIKVGTLNGQANPTYHCLLCNKDLSPEDYRDLMKTIKEKKENNTLRFWRTPKGSDHKLEECVDEEKCNIHGDGQL